MDIRTFLLEHFESSVVTDSENDDRAIEDDFIMLYMSPTNHKVLTANAVLELEYEYHLRESAKISLMHSVLALPKVPGMLIKISSLHDEDDITAGYRGSYDDDDSVLVHAEVEVSLFLDVSK